MSVPSPSDDQMSRLQAKNLRLAYGDRAIVDELSVDIPNGKITVIIGPNACGKSTLLKALARLLKPSQGSVILDGKAIHQMGTKQVAKRLGLLPQTPIAPEGIYVTDLVARGRTPHHTLFQHWSDEDEQAVLDALEATGTLELADRRIDELSGGQRQRVWIAVALAQQTGILLLDEPTTYLDLKHQIEVLNLVKRLNKRDGRTIVIVLHDLNLACRYADHMIAMRDGQILAKGTPEQVITPQTVEKVFDLACEIVADPLSKSPMVVPKVDF